MAKKTKDSEIELKPTKKAMSLAKKSTTKSVKEPAEKKSDTSKKATVSASKEKVPTKSQKSSTAKTTSKSTAKRATTKKTTAKTATAKSTKKATTKKTTAKRTTTRKTTARKAVAKKTTTKTDKPVFQSEYYDLPFGYNKTVVKVLAQTPTTLFVYWEVSEDDRNRLKELYGENFFEVTKPVLILYNDTLNYSFEIEINDFANSWYIHVNDSKCDYRVELGRKPIPMANVASNEQTTNQNNSTYIPYYVYITSSNEMTAPNDRILFRKISKITFRNIKTGEIKERDVKEFKFITNYGIMSLEEIYQYLYPNEHFDYEHFLRNPSSGMTSSRSFSSQFK